MNILGIGRDKSQSAYFSGRDQVPEYETERVQGPATPPGHTARPSLHQGVVWPTPAPPRPLLPPIYCPRDETLSTLSKIHERVCSHRHLHPQIGRDLKLFPAPYRRVEIILEAFFITMPASGVMREQFTLRLWVHIVARWLVLLLCAIMFRSCERHS